MAAATPVRRLIGVYDADGTARGELSYFLRARVGKAHCGLCDITHGVIRKKSEWSGTVAALGVPFDLYHRNDQPADVRAVATRLPAVVAATDDGIVQLLGPEELDECDGSPADLVAAVRAATSAARLSMPTP